jgi:hypothetical protein
VALTTCPRCKKIFDKVVSPVCQKCQDSENAEYDKIRSVLIAIIIFLFGALVYTLWGKARTARDFSQSPIVKQRIINLERNK